MKYLKYIFVFLFISTVAYSQNVKVTDFDIATSTAKQALLNGFYNWAQTESKKVTFDTAFVLDTATGLYNKTFTPQPDLTISTSWQLDALYSQFYTSPSYSWQFDLTGALYGQDNDPDDLDYRGRYTFDAGVNKYFGKSTGFFAGFSANSIYNRVVNEFFNDSTNLYYGGENRPEVNLFAGIGYGRMVNATPMAKAINVDEELRRSGVTKAYLPKSTMLKLAEIIDKESEYKTKYKQTYKAEMIADMQEQIKVSGVANIDKMNSLGYFRIDNVLFENYEGNINYSFTNPRFYGGDISLGIGYQALTRNPALDIPDPSLEAIGEYGYPIGLDHQLFGAFDMRSSFDTDFGKAWEGNARLDYWYNMTNRVRFFTNYVLSVVRDAQANNNNTLTYSDFSYSNHAVGAGFMFYLENYVTFQIQGAYNFLHEQSETFSTNAALSFIIL